MNLSKKPSDMRLSRKASDLAHQLAHQMSQEVRKVAACRAHNEERDFADENDIRWAYSQVLGKLFHEAPKE